MCCGNLRRLKPSQTRLAELDGHFFLYFFYFMPKIAEKNPLQTLKAVAN